MERRIKTVLPASSHAKCFESSILTWRMRKMRNHWGARRAWWLSQEWVRSFPYRETEVSRLDFQCRLAQAVSGQDSLLQRLLAGILEILSGVKGLCSLSCWGLEQESLLKRGLVCHSSRKSLLPVGHLQTAPGNPPETQLLKARGSWWEYNC